MATLTPEKEDTLNPGQKNWDQKTSAQLSSAEQSALDGIENNYDQTADDSNENANIDKLRNQERQPAAPTSSKEKSEETEESRRSKTLNFVKQKGPLGLILSAFMGFSFLGFGMMAPGIALVQIKEIFVKDFNDSVKSYDKKQTLLYKKKLKAVTGTRGICTRAISIKCRFNTMSDKQIKKLEDSGFRVKPEETERKKNMFGRNAVEAIEFDEPDPNNRDNKRTVTVDARNFNKYFRDSVHFRSMMFKAYNPRFSSLTGKVSKKVTDHFNTNRTRKLSGDKKNMDKQVDDAVKEGEKSHMGKAETTKKDDQGRWVDENGPIDNGTPEGDARVKALDAAPDSSQLNELGKKASGSILTKGMNAVNIAGDVDSYCSVMKMLRLVSAASKVVKHAQLLRYAFVFLNTADSIKAGTATPEAVEYASNKLTHQDFREQVLDQEKAAKTGQWDNDVAFDSEDYKTLKDNPDKGKNAFDSQLYRASAYGSVEESTLRTSQYAIGFGFTGALAGLAKQMEKTLPGGVATCKVVQSVYVRGLGLIVGVVSIVFSGGAAKAITKGATVAAFGAAVYFATAYIQSTLKDMAENDIVSGDTEGLDTGQAIGSGTNALLGSNASASGLAPVSTEDTLKNYTNTTASTQAEYDEVARYDAQDTPFDIYNSHSFLGSIVASLGPVYQSPTSNFLSVMSIAPKALAMSASVAVPFTSAATASPVDRYKKCTDPSFADINLQFADLNCGIRFGLTEEELNADPDVLADWMLEHKQIDPNTGAPITTAEAQKALFRAVSDEQVSGVLNNNLDSIAQVDRPLPDPNATKATLTATPMPPKNEGEINYPDDNGRENDILQDTRTFAHWFRFCRYGDKDGRMANFGDPDGLTQSFLSGLLEEDYQSSGSECLDSNACKTPDLNNSEQAGTGWDTAQKRCRPAVYKIYRAYYATYVVNEDMDDPQAEGAELDPGSADSRALAKRVAENPNIKFAMPGTQPALKEYASSGNATNFCGQPMKLKSELLQVILDNAEKYKITLNNFGFKEDRYTSCDQGQHPKGGAIDLNAIEQLDGDKKNCPSINYQGDCGKVVNAYARDWMINLAKRGHKTLGGAGQAGCSAEFNLTSNPPSEIEVVAAGNLHFADGCDHLHIDVGDRKGRST
jgi:hypothetical protein